MLKLKADEFLGALTKLQNETLASSCVSGCPSVRMYQLDFRYANFHDVLYCVVVMKFVEKFLSLLSIGQN